MLKRKQLLQATAAAALVMSSALGGTVILAQGNGNGAGQAQHHGARAFVGISLENTADGVRVVQVVAGSPAETAGLQAGDILTAINGTDIASASDARQAIIGLSAGDTVSLSFTRDGEAQTVELTLVEAPERMGRGERGLRLLQQMSGIGLEYDQQTETWTVTEVAEDSPLYAAGLRAGDVLTSVDGEAFSPRALVQALMAAGEGSQIALTITRDGETQDLSVNVEDLMQLGLLSRLPGMDFAAPFGRGEGGMGGRGDRFGMMARGGQLGLVFQPLDADVASANDLSVTEGALVREIVPGSPAETAGLQVGDVITAVNGEAVNEEWTLRDRVQAYEPGDVLTLDVLRAGATQQIGVTLSEPMAAAMGFGDLQSMMPDGQMLQDLLQHMQQGQPPALPGGQPNI
jgi:S1-C subfamily serine protease